MTCSCQNCLNLQCNAELVAHTRTAIETRNPLAVLPKIVVAKALVAAGVEHHASLAADDGETPRHKKGCHCKKSACLKKYCECYQAGVQCTDTCRCEGCKNADGRAPRGGAAGGPFTLPARSSSHAVGVSPAPITPAEIKCA